MKNLMNRILSVFNRKNSKELQFDDIYKVCMSASDELGEYCKVEGFNSR